MYLIWVGEYSDKDVIAVCEDETTANAYARLHNGYVSEALVITDENYIQRANDMITEWKFCFEIISTGVRLVAIYEQSIEPNEKKKDIAGNSYTYIYVYEDDTEKAKKIAWDRAYKRLAEKAGL